MKNSFLLLSLYFITSISFAQPIIQWERSFGGISAETALKIIRTPDEGYLVGSLSLSNNGDVNGNHGGGDFWLLKLNSDGVKQWQKCLGGFDSDVVIGLENVASGGYIAVGNTFSNGNKTINQVFGNHGGQDIWVTRLDANGNIQWRQCYGGCDQDDARAILQTADGNFVIVGGTQSINTGDVYGVHADWDAWIIKIDPNGTMIWQKTIGGTGIDYLYAVKETPNGNLIVAGLSSSINGDLAGADNKGQEDFWIAQLSANGLLQWNRTYGGSAYDGARSMCLDAAGGIFVTGVSGSNDGDISGYHGNNEAWTLRLDSDGELLWERSFGGTGSDVGFSVFQRTDNDYILCGETSSYNGDVSGNHGGTDVWVVKFDKNGILKDQICLGGSNNELARSAIAGDLNEIVIGGTSSSMDGDVSQNKGGSDTWVVKLNVPLGLKPDVPKAALFELSIAPNPAADWVQVSTNASGLKHLEVYDETGKLLINHKMMLLDTSIPIQTLAAGNYLIKMILEDGKIQSAPFVKH